MAYLFGQAPRKGFIPPCGKATQAAGLSFFRQSQQEETIMANAGESELEKRETNRLIAADKVEGTAVYNRSGDRLGSIENVMLDKLSGKVAYAVMSFGGFLGIGDRHHPLPWSVLTYDTRQGGYVVDLDKKTLEGAPSYEAGKAPNMEEETGGRQVHDYYRVPPYWI